MIQTEKIFSPNTLIQQLPPSRGCMERLESHKETARALINRTDTRIPIIVGPCSVHDSQGALKFGEKLYKLSLEVSDRFFLIMRVHVEKPRTTIGWKGLMYDPYINGTNDLHHGLRLSRQLLLQLSEIGIPIATEILSPMAYRYYYDLLSWGFIGARTSSSQVHRELASSMNIPIGYKNLTDGNLTVPINSIIASRSAHTYLAFDQDGDAAVVHSTGNPYSHLVLRGSELSENYDMESVLGAISLQNNSGIHTPILVDCAHGNSKKDPERQMDVFRAVIEYMQNDIPDILGISLESNLEGGSQPCEFGSDISSDLSITDPCLSWSDTKRLILESYQLIKTDRAGTDPVVCR